MSTKIRRGMIVDYVLPNKKVRPAIVLEVVSPTCVTLSVFLTADDLRSGITQENIPQGNGKTPGCWSWQEEE